MSSIAQPPPAPPPVPPNIAKSSAAITNPATQQDIIHIYDDIDEFDRNLPPTVTLLRTVNGTKVYLVGTAHFSRASQTDVSVVIQNVRPEIVVLELCPLRLHLLQKDEAKLLAEATNLSWAKRKHIFQQHGFVGGLFYISFLQVTASITKQLGIAPGGECRRALAEIERLNNDGKVYLGDRSIYVTMQRAMGGLTWKDKLKLAVYSFVYSSGSQAGSITAADVELMKSKTVQPVGGRPDEFGQIPAIYNAFVRERDEILSYSLQYAARKLPKKTGAVVGIVGIGHVRGVKRHWGRVTEERVKALMTLPAVNARTKTSKNGLLSLALMVMSIGAASGQMWLKNQKRSREL